MISDAFSLPHDMKLSEGRTLLLGFQYDQAPVFKEERLYGWIRSSHLRGRGRVETAATPLDQTAILSRDTSVGDVIQTVSDAGFVFLAGAQGINQFVVPSDLDRHVVRCYLYVLISEIEMKLAELVQSSATPEQIVDLLGTEERSRYDAASDKNRETRPVEYLMLRDYQSLAPQVPELANMYPNDQRRVSRTLHQLNELRNCVAHPSRSLTGTFDEAEIAARSRLAESFLDALRGMEAIKG